MKTIKENTIWQGESASPIVRALLKKWKSILTRYSKLRDNWWIRTKQRWMIRVKVDCSINKEYYLNKIESAIKIIDSLS